jgi:hypothetical protein
MNSKTLSSKSQSQIVDRELYQALINENHVLREKLLNVSALGTTMMFHTHNKDCDNFTRDFLKAIVSIDHHIKIADIKNMYQQGYELAAKPSVLEEPLFTHLKIKKEGKI